MKIDYFVYIEVVGLYIRVDKHLCMHEFYNVDFKT